MTTDPLLVSSTSLPNSEELVSRLLADFKNHYGLEIAEDPVAVQRIREAVNIALRTLQNQDRAEIFLPYLSANAAGPIHLKRLIIRSDAAPAVDKDISEPVQDAPQRVNVPLPDHKPKVTLILIVLLALIYVLQELTGYYFPEDLPALWGKKINQAIIVGEYWRLITPMLLHGSVIHLGFNLYALYILGTRIERFFGSFRFVLLFLAAGITGNLFSFIFTPADSLGSSTAIFGLLAAEGIFIYQHRELFGDRSRLALRQIIQVAVINFIIGLSPAIDNWGHMGGLIGGAIYSWFAGPIFHLDRESQRLRFVDHREENTPILVFVVQLLLLAFLTGWVILSRS